MKRKSAILVKTEKDDDANSETMANTQQVLRPKDANPQLNNPRAARNREIVKRIVETSRANQSKYPPVLSNSATTTAIELARGRRVIEMPQTRARIGNVGHKVVIQTETAAKPNMESFRSRTRAIQNQNTTDTKRQPVRIVEEVATKVSAVYIKVER